VCISGMSYTAAIESRKLGREQPAARWGSLTLPLFVLPTATALLPRRTPAAGEGGEVPGSQQGREVRRGEGRREGRGKEREGGDVRNAQRLRKKLSAGSTCQRVEREPYEHVRINTI
jgi:hypothetical protein